MRGLKMFSKYEKNINVVEGCYRKLKSYYYYNKNFISIREKIAHFENDENQMVEAFSHISALLSKPNSKVSKEYIQSLIDRIDFFAIPKGFEIKDNINKPVSNTMSRDKKLKTVNFFIDMPIELHILDTLWTICLGKITYDNSLLSHDIYGNTIAESVIYDNQREDNTIDFESNRLFNTYFPLYSKWRNGAFDALNDNYNSGKDSILVSLDIKSYYYSVKWDFSLLSKTFKSSKMLDEIKSLSNIMEKIYAKFYSILSTYRKDISKLKKREYPLPIGLFSSMLLGNLYLLEFDKKVREISNMSYYGRYVDDLLFVFKAGISENDTYETIISSLFIDNNLLVSKDKDYCISGYDSLGIQSKKIKIVYINHNESKAIIDIYNDTIKQRPSQMNPIPDFNLDLADFDENIYSIENFTKENKLRDIGHIAIDPFKVGKYFSSIVYRHINVNAFEKNISDIIDEQIPKIEKFFAGAQGIEFHIHWLNYMYFLVITHRHKQLRRFINNTKKSIQELDYKTLDKNTYKRPATINKRAKSSLLSHLENCLMIALALDIDMVNKQFPTIKKDVKMFQRSNMFNHNLVALPLTNYLEYSRDISYIKMQVKDIEKIPKKLENTFKFKWTPRFIHYEEILLLLFYYYYNKNGVLIASEFTKDSCVDKFQDINFLKYRPFEIYNSNSLVLEQYRLNEIKVPDIEISEPAKISIAVGNIKIHENNCIQNLDRWKGLSITEKEKLRSILRECYSYCKEDVKILVLPELYVPIYWLKELINFSKKAQIAIIAGLQYMPGKDNVVHNYIVTILPFQTSRKKYKNAFIHIREKNDYSPIEKELLAREHLRCENSKIADYQIFQWKGIALSSFVCFELTDILARALLKGRCDIIAAPVFNPDTAYFANIIDSTVRDIHAIIVQANTSCYGDSRITGPYDKNSKDIFKIKGGDNDLVIIGTIEFDQIVQFQSDYYSKEKKHIDQIDKESQKKRSRVRNKIKSKPDIKRLSARFYNKRTGRI